MKKQGKLVRDKIPQIIKKNGQSPITKVLSDKEYLVELDKKLHEEVQEYQNDKSLEEMADIIEVIFAICKARGYSIDELFQVKDEKQKIRGSFDDKIYLINIEKEN